MQSSISRATCSRVVAAVLVTCASVIAQDGSMTSKKPMAGASTMDKASLDKLVASYPERPRLGAVQMIAKYGAPQEATSDHLIWHNAGDFKRIELSREETPHDFPLPHMDFLRHTIEYRVPMDKVRDVLEFDASTTIDPTPGECSAKCDLEGHNILTFNLINDIVTGKKNVKQARESFGQNVKDDVAGKMPPYVVALQFKPPEAKADFADVPIIDGSPRRAPEGAAAMTSGKMSDAEILAMLVVVNLNESTAAAEARMKKDVDPKVIDYAKMMQTEHGMNNEMTMKLGKTMNVVPMITPPVDQMRVKGAGDLAALVPLEGAAFSTAYIAAMVKDHTMVLDMIDKQMLPAASDPQLKAHLTKTREHIAMHLEKAKQLQSGMGY